MNKINAGVTVMQDFCRPSSDTFANYIDYLDREEAQRNNAITTFNLFNDYMGNPYKSTGLFTADKDALTFQEKKELKSIFNVAQENESVMWQTVISFDNQWLEKNGIYDSKKKVLDERKIKETTRLAVNRLLASEGLEQATWSAGIHYNTDNIHIHIAIVEPYPMRKKMLYNGKWEVRGKFKLSSINKCKSAVVNELMQTREMNQKINFVIRQDMVEKLKAKELSNDPEIRDQFMKLVQDLPKGKVNYKGRTAAPFRKQIDAISNVFLDKYCPEKKKEFLELVEHQSRLYAEAYGGGNEYDYKNSKQQELMERMGNSVIRATQDYQEKLDGKINSIEKEDSHGSTEHDKIEEIRKIESAAEMGTDSKTSISEEDPGDFVDDGLDRQAQEDPEYFADGGFKQRRKMIKRNSKYAQYFEDYKRLRDNVNDLIRNKGELGDTLEVLKAEAENNPFVKEMLGQMYLYGNLVEISPKTAQDYFAGGLEIYEEDMNHISVKKSKFFKGYLEYKIGKMYERGWGTEQDSEIAASWFEASGTKYAIYCLGNLYYDGEGVEQDYQKALKLYKYAAESESNDLKLGSPFAILKCAKMYDAGIGTEANKEKSTKYYQEALQYFLIAEEKQANALFEYQIGNMYYNGLGCEKDLQKAIQYLEEAVKEKNIPSILLLSNIYQEQMMEDKMKVILPDLEELAGKGENELAQYTLGRVYTKEWIFYDLEKGIDYLTRSAEQGNQYAQYQLGKLYINPDLEIYDLQKGIDYLTRSAEQGNQYAQYQLGKLYINPDLEIYDLQKGIDYLTRSVEQGNQYAQYQLGKVYLDPTLGVYDPEKGFSLLERSMRQGNEAAQYRLGKEYLNKNCIFYNPVKGLQYIYDLAEKGNAQAQLKIGLEYIKGENVTKDLFEAKRWLEKAAIQDNEMAKAVLADLSTAPMRRLAPMGEFDKALIELRRSLYQAEEETRKNLLIYEMELEAELTDSRELYI